MSTANPAATLTALNVMARPVVRSVAFSADQLDGYPVGYDLEHLEAAHDALGRLIETVGEEGDDRRIVRRPCVAHVHLDRAIAQLYIGQADPGLEVAV